MRRRSISMMPLRRSSPRVSVTVSRVEPIMLAISWCVNGAEMSDAARIGDAPARRRLEEELGEARLDVAEEHRREPLLRVGVALDERPRRSAAAKPGSLAMRSRWTLASGTTSASTSSVAIALSRCGSSRRRAQPRRPGPRRHGTRATRCRPSLSARTSRTRPVHEHRDGSWRRRPA